MKRILAITFGVIISASLGMSLSAMALTEQEESILDRILEESGVGRTYNRDAKELRKLSKSDIPFENLYVFIYDNLKKGPQDEAIKQIAKLTIYSESELEEILVNGNIEGIIAKWEEREIEREAEEYADEKDEEIGQREADCSALSGEVRDDYKQFAEWYCLSTSPNILYEDFAEGVLSQDAILEEYSFLEDLYSKELEFQQTNRQVIYQALASEMFFNNDVSDSAGIDILYDLDLINYLLFGEFIVYPDRIEGEVELASSSFEDALEVYLAQEDEDEEEIDEEVEFEVYACYEDEDLRERLTAFEEGEEKGVVEEEEEEEVEEEEEAETQVLTGAADEAEPIADVEDFIYGIDDAEPGDWTRDLPCNEYFCITVNLVTETDEPPEVERYEKTDNCIACHTAYIKERVGDTLSKSLAPSKVSMNWFEDATCKSAGKEINLDLNVYTVKMPVDLDPGDDTDEIAEANVEELKNSILSISGFNLPWGTRDITKKTVKDIACDSLVNLIDVGGIEQDVEKAIEKCTDEADEIETAVAEAYEKFIYEGEASHNDPLFEQVASELYTMFLYFKEFNASLEATYLTDDAPLKSLISKQYCE